MNYQIVTIRKYGPLYIKAFEHHLDKLSGPHDNAPKTIFLFVRYLNAIGKAYPDKEKLLIQYYAVVELIGRLTPRELIKIFPIDKVYDGTKDYFYTMNALNRIGMDTQIDKNAAALIGDYMNWDLHIFKVNIFGLLSDRSRHTDKTEKCHQTAATDSDGKTKISA